MFLPEHIVNTKKRNDGLNKFFDILATRIIELPRYAKSALVVFSDMFICLVSVWVAFNLEWRNFIISDDDHLTLILEVFCVSLVLAIPIFIFFGMYKAIYRFIGFTSLASMSGALLFYSVAFAGFFFIGGVPSVPRPLGLIQPFLMIFFIGVTRLMVRSLLSDHRQKSLNENAHIKRVLIYGAGSAGRQLALAVGLSQDMKVVGFLEDDKSIHGHVMNSIPIYNSVDLVKVLNKTIATDVFLALPSISRARRNEILQYLSSYKLKVQTLPTLNDLASGKVTLTDIRDPDIDDLLAREVVNPDLVLLNKNTRNKKVLVTGAGGSIGSELCIQIFYTNPKQIILVEMNEFALYQIHRKLLLMLESSKDIKKDSNIRFTPEIIPLLGSVCDESRMQEIMSTFQPEAVYHSAAYKHVPIVEHNPIEGLRNNVWGTWVCAQAALKFGVENFTLVSTDKAVRPTNIMGASKRLAEMLLQALSQSNGAGVTLVGLEKRTSTCFSIVRFGNVLGSSGSVVPLFREQIKNGGPITLTHYDITRYFMSITEAAQLVLQASSMSLGGEVFVLDMGQPVKILDLAKRMIDLSGLSLKTIESPEGDIEIITTGLRPGEKLYEELLIGNSPQVTEHSKIMKANEKFLFFEKLLIKLKAIEEAMKQNNVPLLIEHLKDLLPEYQPHFEVVDWVHMQNNH